MYVHSSSYAECPWMNVKFSATHKFKSQKSTLNFPEQTTQKWTNNCSWTVSVEHKSCCIERIHHKQCAHTHTHKHTRVNRSDRVFTVHCKFCNWTSITFSKYCIDDFCVLHIGTYVLYAVLVSLYVYQAHHRHCHIRDVLACVYTALVHIFDVTSIHVSTWGINSNFPLTLSLASFSLARLAVASLASCHLPLPCRLAWHEHVCGARILPFGSIRLCSKSTKASAHRTQKTCMAMAEKKLQ